MMGKERRITRKVKLISFFCSTVCVFSTRSSAEDLMVYCVEKKDPHNSELPSLVFPRHLDSLL